MCLVRLAELPKNGKQYDAINRIGAKVGQVRPSLSGHVVASNIGADRQGRLKIPYRAWVPRDGFRQELATRMPLTRQSKPETIFAGEFSVVRIDGKCARPHRQGSVDFAPEEKSEHLCLQGAYVLGIQFHGAYRCLDRPLQRHRGRPIKTIPETKLVDIGH
ncbi:hypothetical protein ILFOPFJJ_07042 [Ensifer psoraleae]|nr:hypothetical protein [Sinorhizobium psoraleae]